MTGSCIVSTGFFDGVHLGHRRILETLSAEARRAGAESLALTFWPHPRTVFQQDARGLKLLSGAEEKRALMRSCGVDRVEQLPFTRDFGALTMEEYLRDWVIGRYGAGAVVLGYDNRMGCDCTGVEDLLPVCRRLGLETILVPPVPVGDSGEPGAGEGPFISSTRIRKALSEGNVEAAARMLGRPYTLQGVVVEGNRLGRTLGFPTANLGLSEPLKILPADGVYLVRVRLEGKLFFGMCNVGTRPTLAPAPGGPAPALHRSVETHIFDFDRDIYGLDLSLAFLRRIRAERRFPSLEALSSQLAADRDACADLLSAHPALREQKAFIL